MRNTLLVTFSLIIGWFAVMAVSMALFEPTDSALAIVTDYSILERLPDHVRFTATGTHTITFRSDEPGFVADIYKAGGILVFPALSNGCIALRPDYPV